MAATRTTLRAPAILCSLLLLAGCGGEAGGDGPSGSVTIDGSSTVQPVSAAMAEDFQIANRGTRVTVGTSGTGGGFEKFCGGETDISNASREITPGEAEACEANGIEYLELPVAGDGVTVVAHPENDWAQCLTVDELRRVWQPGSTIESWSDIRDGFPDVELELYGPDTDSGTFDYFTEAIVGEADASRSDYTASADDNVLVIGVEGDRASLGYFGFAYYEQNRDRLKALAVDAGDGCVEPTRETIESGEYAPLSRPLFIYVSRSALERPVVDAFVRFYLDNATEIVPQVGYVPLPAERYDEVRERLPAPPAAGASGAGTGEGTESDGA